MKNLLLIPLAMSLMGLSYYIGDALTVTTSLRVGTATGVGIITDTIRGEAQQDLATLGALGNCLSGENIAVTGAALGDACILGLSTAAETAISYSCVVTAPDVAVVSYCGTGNPADRTYYLLVLGKP